MINYSGPREFELYTKTILTELFFKRSDSDFHENVLCEILERSDGIEAKLKLQNKEFLSRECFADHHNKRIATTTAIGKCASHFAKTLGMPFLPYGVLIGVRPFKIALELLKKYSLGETARRLKEFYLVSDEKIDLLINTALFDLKKKEEHDSSDCSVYISVPFCPSRCNYCSFISKTAPSRLSTLSKYVDEVISEIIETSKMIYKNSLNIKSIYVGGGTPTVLQENDLERLLKTVADVLGIPPEFTVEAGRPDTLSEGKLNIMKRFGVSRTSINTQTTNDEVLKRIGRNHSAEDFFKAFELAKSFNFKDLNTDLIAGLDGETHASFKKSVEDVISLSPDNITIHTLALKKSSSIRHRSPENISQDIDDFLSFSKNRCITTGYLPYYLYRQKYSLGNHENVGYSLPGHECHYNVAMMNEIEHIFGIGAGATSRIIPKNAGEKISHYANFKYSTEYVGHSEKYIENLAQMQKELDKNR